MMSGHRRLDEILLTRGIISEPQIRAALEEQGLIGGRLGEHLLQRGDLTEDELLAALSEQFGVPGIDLLDSPPEQHALDRLPLSILEQHTCVPFSYSDEEDVLQVAFADPTDRAAIGRVEEAAQPSQLTICVALESHINQILQRHQGSQGESAADSAGADGGTADSEVRENKLIDLLELALASHDRHAGRATPRPVWAARLADEVCRRLGLPVEVRQTVRLACLTSESAAWHRQSARRMTPRESLALSSALLRSLDLPWDVVGVFTGLLEGRRDFSTMARATDVVRVIWAIADSRRNKDDLDPLDAWQGRAAKSEQGLDQSILEVAFSVLRGRTLRQKLAGRPSELMFVGTGPIIGELIELAGRPPYRAVPSPTWSDAMALAERRLPDVICVDVANAAIPDATTMHGDIRTIGIDPATVLFMVDSAIPDPVAALVKHGARALLARAGGAEAVLQRIAKVLSSQENPETPHSRSKRGHGEEPFVSGRLQDLGLTDMIQVLSASQKSCRVDLTHPGGEAVLWFDRGEIVHAQHGRQKGDQAFFEILAWPEGYFEVHPVTVLPGRNITTHTTGLLLEGCRILDESRHRGAPALR